MSQVQRQDAGQDGEKRGDTSPSSSSSSSSSSYLTSTLAKRGPPSPTSSPFSNALIPRDYLGQRSDAPNLRTAAAPARKTNPSPLQSSYSPQTPSTETPVANNMPARAGSNSPREAYENLSKRTRSGLADAVETRNITPPGGPVLDHNMFNDGSSQSGKTTPPDIGGHFPATKAAMGPPPRPQPAASPPDSPTSTVSSNMTDRPSMRHKQMPRTSSIDSAISSISSTASHSQKPSIDAGSVHSAEIANLIAAAGSPEAVILHLLKEKRHAASQNAQLWKLVDKQRALVLGLNKDLERALTDKDRYRKKLKEVQSKIPAAPSMVPNRRSGSLRKGSESPASSDVVERKLQQTETSESVREGKEQDMHLTPKKLQETRSGSSPVDTTLVPSPLHLLEQAQEAATTPAHLLRNGTSSEQQSPTDKLPSLPTFKSSPPALFDRQEMSTPTGRQLGDHPSSPTLPRSRDTETPIRSPPPLPPLQSALEPPTLSVIEPSPLAEKPGTMLPPPSRKAPPAPLNLNMENKASEHLHQTSPGDPSDSEYDDILEVDEIPAFERGRRKTRGEDDKEREVAMIREKEARSRSKRKKLPNGGSMPPEAVGGVQSPEVPAALPTSPRQMVAQAPPTVLAKRLSPPDSLAAMLSPGSSDGQSISERLIASPPPMSPGLPVSPRPIDRPLGSPLPRNPRDNNAVVTSPPLSPRLGMMPSIPLSPRAPKHPIPLPPNTPLSLGSPPPGNQNAPSFSPSRTEMPPQVIPTIGYPPDQATSSTSPMSPRTNIHQIYRGLVDENYPDLLLSPNALPSVDVKVASSRLRPSRNSYIAPKPYEEEPVFTLSIFSRSERSELWRIEKVILALPQLDQQIKAVTNFSARLPDRKLFSGHSPAIIDARRNALNVYFDTLLDTPMDEKAAIVLCHFLSTDAIEPRDDETSLLGPSSRPPPVLTLGPDGRPRKEGYLTKRGKNFGGWKARFFVLQGPELKYYESPGGPHLGNIKLQNAQIGKQSQSTSPSRSEDDIENQYRHAFLVLEPKRKDSTSLVRHVLCAESDKERDEWVDALLSYVDYESDEEQPRPASKRAESGKSHITGFEAKVRQYSSNSTPTVAEDADSPSSPPGDQLKGFSYEDAVPAKAPTRIAPPPIDRTKDGTPSPTTTHNSTPPGTSHGSSLEPGLPAPQSQKSISGPSNGMKIDDAGLWGNKPAPSPMSAKDKEHRKRSIWGFRQRSSSDLIVQAQHQVDTKENLTFQQHPEQLQQLHNASNERHQPIRAVFGIPLAEAVELCPPRGVDVYLPAVVYRCIEYLRAKKAASEEGIFRLSGSNVVVRSLKERFNTEGDLDFLAGEHYYDVHAVASLFKSYLRELPSTILTRELHLDFLHVLELDEKKKKIAAFNGLVRRLPKANLCLLEALSQYLIEIVSNSDKNKMTVRNVGIVFSPTLNIPAPVFSMFLTDFDAIFRNDIEEPQLKAVEVTVDKPMTPEDIRSPRHQMFSDIPTPAYNQTSFPNPHAEQDRTQKLDTSEETDTGFIPLQPSYEQRVHGQPNTSDQRQGQSQSPNAQVQPQQQAQYGSMNRMLAPSNASSVKAKRRESSMLFMGTLHRKSSMSTEDQSLVEDDTAFD